MAAEALGGKTEAIELPDRSHFVAGITVDDSMCTDQRETILMLIDIVDRDLPAVGVVAQLAFGSVLTAMQVGMAVLALIRSIGKFQIVVAIATCDGRVSSTKRETGPGMIEFDLALNYLPIRCGVARGTRQIELAMRILRGCQRPDRLGMQGARAEQGQHRSNEESEV